MPLFVESCVINPAGLNLHAPTARKMGHNCLDTLYERGCERVLLLLYFLYLLWKTFSKLLH